MSYGDCAIWGTSAQIIDATDDGTRHESARAGGSYRIAGTAAVLLPGKPLDFRAKLTTWIIDQHRAGVETPTINSLVLDTIQARPKLRVSERKLRFFLWLISMGYDVGDDLDLYGTMDDSDQQSFAAWTECKSAADAIGFTQLLIGEGILASNTAGVHLTHRGFDQLEKAETGGAVTNQAFVAMWFSLEMDAIYDMAIEPAVSAAGFKAFRIDRKEHTNKIDDEIIAEIRKSKFVIADFTCGTFLTEGGKRSEARGGVYYEAGFAMGLRTPVIWTVRKDCIDYVHFDTRQFPHILWSSAEELKKGLYHRIASVIGTLPGSPGLK